MKRLCDLYIRHAGWIGAIFCAVPTLVWFVAMLISIPFREVYLLRLGLCLVVGCPIAAYLNRYGVNAWLCKHRSQTGPATTIDGVLVGAAIGIGFRPASCPDGTCQLKSPRGGEDVHHCQLRFGHTRGCNHRCGSRRNRPEVHRSHPGHGPLAGQRSRGFPDSRSAVELLDFLPGQAEADQVFAETVRVVGVLLLLAAGGEEDSPGFGEAASLGTDRQPRRPNCTRSKRSNSARRSSPSNRSRSASGPSRSPEVVHPTFGPHTSRTEWGFRRNKIIL